MDRVVYDRLQNMTLSRAEQDRTIAYLADHLGRFLRVRERVLICFPEHREGNLSWLMEQAVYRCGADPIVWGPDRTWKTLLRQAFSHKTSAIIGQPLILLGLTKLKKYNGTPLYVRKVITAGYPCPDWVIEGLEKGFDCEVGGCFAVSDSPVVAGFACGQSWGVHIREDAYKVKIVDDAGRTLPNGALGHIILSPTWDPEMEIPIGDRACLIRQPCRCGSTSPRLVNMQAGENADPDLAVLGQELHSWTSILDCQLIKGESGLEIEIIRFPGEQLPKLPTAAKLIIRAWEPSVDVPFPYGPQEKEPEKKKENH